MQTHIAERLVYSADLIPEAIEAIEGFPISAARPNSTISVND